MLDFLVTSETTSGGVISVDLEGPNGLEMVIHGGTQSYVVGQHYDIGAGANDPGPTFHELVQSVGPTDKATFTPESSNEPTITITGPRAEHGLAGFFDGYTSPIAQVNIVPAPVIPPPV